MFCESTACSIASPLWCARGLRVVDLMFPDQNGLLLRWLMYAFASYVVCAGHCGSGARAGRAFCHLHCILLAVPLLFMMPPIQHIANVLLFDGIFSGWWSCLKAAAP